MKSERDYFRAERDALQRAVAEIAKWRSCLGAGPMDYEAFVREIDAALAAALAAAGAALPDQEGQT